MSNPIKPLIAVITLLLLLPTACRDTETDRTNAQAKLVQASTTLTQAQTDQTQATTAQQVSAYQAEDNHTLAALVSQAQAQLAQMVKDMATTQGKVDEIRAQQSASESQALIAAQNGRLEDYQTLAWLVGFIALILLAMLGLTIWIMFTAIQSLRSRVDRIVVELPESYSWPEVRVKRKYLNASREVRPTPLPSREVTRNR